MSQPIFYLCPYRFTTNPADMIRFYETLGLVTKVGRDRENFAVLSGSGGRIGVHELDSAHTSTVSTDMCFETPDAETAAAHFRELGVTATVVDESYGRRVDVGDATHTVTVNEEMRDFYGYTQGTDAARGPTWWLRISPQISAPTPAGSRTSVSTPTRTTKTGANCARRLARASSGCTGSTARSPAARQ